MFAEKKQGALYFNSSPVYIIFFSKSHNLNKTPPSSKFALTPELVL